MRLVVQPLRGTGPPLTPAVTALAEPLSDTDSNAVGTASTVASVASVDAIDATVIAPAVLLDLLAGALAREVVQHWPDPGMLSFRTLEDSGHDSRVYVLLVARTADTQGDGASPVRRWGRDYLGTGRVSTRAAPVKPARGKGNGPGKGRKMAAAAAAAAPFRPDYGPLAERIARRVVGDLVADVARGGCGDAYLQDQVVVFQALAAGRTCFWRGEGGEGGGAVEGDNEAAGAAGAVDEDEVRQALEKLDFEDAEETPSKPFGQGSLHAATARWVTAQLLPGVRWSADGTVCEGCGPWPTCKGT